MKKHYSFIAIICLILSLNSFAQHNRFYNSYSAGSPIYWDYISQTDSGYIAIGNINTTTIWAQIDSTGMVTTCKTYNSPTQNVKKLSNNKFISVSSNYYNDSIYCMELSPVGNVIWAKKYYIPLAKMNCSVCELNTDHSLTFEGVGVKSNTNPGVLFLIKTDSMGNILKTSSFIADTTADHNIFTTGSFDISKNNAIYIPLQISAWHPFETPNPTTDLIKMDTSLNIQWIHSILGYSNTLLVNNNKLYTVANPYLFNNGTSTYYYYTDIGMYDTLGNCLKYGRFGENYKGCSQGIITKDGGMVFFGNRGGYNNTGVATKVDSSLNILWSQYYLKYPGNYSSIITSVAQTKDDGFIMTSDMTNTSSLLFAHGFILKSDSIGHYGCNDSASIYSPGYSSNIYHKDSGFVSVPLSITAKAISVTTGTTIDTVINYCYNIITGEIPLTRNTSINIYPNPGKGMYTFSLQNSELESGTIEVYNMLGMQVTQYNFNKQQFNLDLSTQPQGVYLYRLITPEGKLISTGKLIKE